MSGIPPTLPDGEVMAAIPAATVVLLRDGATGLEALLVRRNSKLEFAGGMWVFPGGRLDADDFAPELEPAGVPDAIVARDAADPAHGDWYLAAARRAARREAIEEADLAVDADSLVWFAHWTPPAVSMKRFATWFFVARAPDGAVTVDGGEIHAHAWMTPADAQRRRNELEIELAPPTWITLSQLLPYATVDDALDDLRRRGPQWFSTRFAMVEGGAVALYHGDAGYDTSEADLPGGRHRLWMLGDGWRYERDDEPSPAS